MRISVFKKLNRFWGNKAIFQRETRMKQEIWHGDCLELMKDVIFCERKYNGLKKGHQTSFVASQ